MDKMNSRDHSFGVPSHGYTEPTKSGRDARSPRNSAEGYFPNKIDEYFLKKCQFLCIWTNWVYLTKIDFRYEKMRILGNCLDLGGILKLNLGYLDTF